MTTEEKPYPPYRSRVEYIRALEQAEAEVKRLRVQLGCVKALATLWEECAVQMDAENSSIAGMYPFEDQPEIVRAASLRSHAAAIREMLSDD